MQTSAVPSSFLQPTTKRGQRGDIQGLRAIAVLMVVAFHADLPVPGGFLGVDVFFVISGFVIAQSLHREWQRNGRISLRGFYVRRFKRLTPALALMILGTLAVSALLLSPLGAMQTAAQTGFAAMLMAANLSIFLTSGSYFDAPAETNPLLHTWSLSVEEQFYLIFPLLLFLLWRSRFGRQHRGLTIGVVSLASLGSLALALLPQPIDWIPFSSFLTGFYGPVARVWEFGFGAVLALATLDRRMMIPWASRSLTVLGTLLLAASCWVIPAGAQYPGPWTMIPVVATLALILGGSLSRDGQTQSLAARPLLYLGDRSYAVYLWHWPFIVFAIVIWPDTPWIPAFAAAVSLAPALATFRWWESPLRRYTPSSWTRFAVVAAVIVLVPLVAARGLLGLANNVLKPMFETSATFLAHPGDTGSASFFEDLSNRYSNCVDPIASGRVEQAFEVRRCFQSKAGQPLEVVLLGDSHAEHLFPGIADEIPDRNVGYLLTGRPDQPSDDLLGLVSSVAQSPTVQTVILGGWWANPALGELDGVQLSRTVDQLTTAGKRVIVTNDVPNFPLDPDRCKWHYGLLLPVRCEVSRERIARQTDAAAGQLLIAESAGATLVDTATLFCDGDECRMTIGDKLAYRDQNHLNATGSAAVGKRIVSEFLRRAED